MSDSVLATNKAVGMQAFRYVPTTMKAVVKHRFGPGAELRTVPVPQVRSREILVKVQATSICGTDVHIYTWDAWSAARIKPPMIFGHEFAGEVVVVGSEVTDVKLGDYVSAETHVVCGTCSQCRTGFKHFCKNTAILGVDIPGAFAEYVVLPAKNAWKNDRSISPEVASVQEPLGNAVHTALAGELIGNTVAVIGCGPIGVLSIGVAKAAGASAIYAIDINDYRLGLASAMGANAVFNGKNVDPVAEIKKLTGGDGVDVVFEMSGNPQAIRQGFEMMRNGGRYSMLGIPAEPMTLDIANAIVFKGATVQGITGRKMFDTWYKTAALLSSGKLDITPVITHRFSLEEFEKGFDLMLSGNCGKVILVP